MSEPLRIFVRVVGAVVFAASLLALAFTVIVGPDQVGQMMGKSCGSGRGTATHVCTWKDVLGMLEALPYLTLVGGVLMLVMRRDWMGREPEYGSPAPAPDGPGRGRARVIGTVAVVVVILAHFAGGFIYRASYYVVTQTETAKEILSTPRPEIERPGSPEPRTKPAADVAPRGLGRGSLLRADAFGRAIADVRRVAPAGARLSKLRVAAGQIDAGLLAGGRALTVRKPWDGKAKVIAKAPALDGDLPLIAFDRLDPAAPQRVVLGAARSAGRKTADIDYLVLLDAAGLRWHGFFAGGTAQVTASPDGRSVR